MNKKEWHVYILECCDDSIYTGVTNNIEKRMRVHASGKGSKYVARKGFRQLIASKPCHDKSHACKCEYEIKQLSRNKKIEWFWNKEKTNQKKLTENIPFCPDNISANNTENLW